LSLIVAIPTIASANPDTLPLLAHAADYTFGFYPHGWRGTNTAGDRIFVIQTNHYALSLNTSKGCIDRLGPLPNPLPASEAVRQGIEFLDTLTAIDMVSEVTIGGMRYTVVQGAPKPDTVVIQRLGRFFQHVEVRGLALRSEDGSTPAGVDARLEIFGWSDRLSVVLHVATADDAQDRELGLGFQFPETSSLEADGESEDLFVRREPSGAGIAFINALPSEQQLKRTGGGIEVLASNANSVAIVMVPNSQEVLLAGQRELAQIRSYALKPDLEASGIAPYTGPLSVTYDPVIGWHRVMLGDNPDINTMERVRLALMNPTDSHRTMRLCFAKEGGSFGITGMCPVLRDASGQPLGLPVQISKNWHVTPPWFTGLTMLELDAGAAGELEFDLAYANWGNSVAISHAQLSLEGWGTNQLWDQMAIGSFGESICYDPDVNLNRGMIDDMRPLMVWGMGEQPKKQWSWTHNVGGGDFLVLFQDGKRKFLSRQKTLYERYGPVLTDVTYAGETPDGAIQSVIRTQSWRSDDYVRALYTIRYDVVDPVENIERLAFFQLGADHYNHNLFSKITTGHILGVVEVWEPEVGGWTYSKRGVSLEGEQPWIALTGATKNPPPHIKEGDQGAWANRGLIVRHWEAVIGGKGVDTPHYSVFGTENGDVPSAVIELSSPPGVIALHKGDYVEAKVEMLILPQRAEDYYGPNEPLRKFLEDFPDSWHIVDREAKQGKVLQRFPVVVQTDSGRTAEFTIYGGTGLVPITIAGAVSRGPFTLADLTDGEEQPIDQSSDAGNDWWQTEYRPETNSYDITFTLPMSGRGEPRTIVWRLANDTS
jgi:hypothetical protein